MADYDPIEEGNIDLNNRPIVKHANGDYSTVYSASFGLDGKEVLLPTVSDDGRMLSNEEAIAQYKKTGKHLGKFSSPEAADAYAKKLHEDQANLYGKKAKANNMAIGTTSAPDPTTGERTEQQFNYTPVDPQQDLMRQAFEQSQQAFYPPPAPHGNTPYWENPQTYYPQQAPIDPIAQAKAATMAAQKFIAFRGYQSDLKEGMAAADAFAKWGPMLVQDTSFGTSLKAMTQLKPYTYNQTTRAYESPGQKPVFNPHAAPAVAPVWVPANPQTGEPAHYLEGGKAQFPPAIQAPKIDPFTLNDYKEAATEFKKAADIYGNPSEATDTRKEAIGRMARAQEKLAMIKKAGTMSAQAPAPMAAPKEIVRLTKDGKQAVFDAATKKFIRYAE